MPTKILQKCVLFKSLSESAIESILENTSYQVVDYTKDQMLYTEGEECTKIGIVIDGILEIRKIYPLGKTVVVTRLKESDIFGEVILFSNMKNYPSTLVSCSSLKVFYVSKKEMINIMEHHPTIMNNLLNILSSKILTLNKKLRNLSYENLRQKISDFILTEYKKQKSSYIELSISRKEMAETLGVTRPSLSRELATMKEDGIIDYHKNTLKIKDLKKLEDFL
ncbi:MAG: Crp/Fnr family transcriptional regulator [Vallitalea sp.]|jgi:CRP-like cAMP-binding protein|nr:Crp/Fnr family transcriptional regulator [Vallitalea sp.]